MEQSKKHTLQIINEITYGDEIQASLDEILGVPPKMKLNPPVRNLA